MKQKMEQMQQQIESLQRMNQVNPEEGIRDERGYIKLSCQVTPGCKNQAVNICRWKNYDKDDGGCHKAMCEDCTVSDVETRYVAIFREKKRSRMLGSCKNCEEDLENDSTHNKKH